MRILIVEDETVAINNLKAILAEVDQSIEILGVTESVSQTVRWLTNNDAPDLIFMDIHLSDGSAFNIFSALTVEVPIIFITAYDEYALNAFKVNSIDYILKPIDVEQLRNALDKFYRLTKLEINQYLSGMYRLSQSESYPERILIPHNDKLLPIDVKSISYFYTSSELTQVFLNNTESYPYRKTLDSIIPGLDSKLFFRANKQFIISKNSIKDITIWFDSRLLITLNTDTPERIYISKNRASEFRQWVVL